MRRRIVSWIVALCVLIPLLPTTVLHPSASNDTWLWPTEGIYNMYRGYYSSHQGIDISAPLSTPVRATKSGTVIQSSNSCPHVNYGDYRCNGSPCNGGCGNYVKIQHDDGTYSRYLHLTQGTAIALGTYVKQGDIIGYSGSSGDSSGPHLHFDCYNTNNVRINNNPTDDRHTYTSYHEGVGISYVYNTCQHTFPNGSKGVCSNCGFVYDWASTFDSSTASYASVVKSDGLYPRTDMPYDAGTRASKKLKKGTEVKILGTVTNAHGNAWYKFSYNNNTEIGYAYSSWLNPTRPLESAISISITWPYENQTIPRQSHNLIGTVISSTNNIVKVTGYLDGNQVSTVSTNTKNFSLAKSDIDYKMPFNALSSGRHTIKIVAVDSAGGTQTLTRQFYTESSPAPAATVTTEDTANGKFVVMSCPGGNISYTTSNGESGSGSGTARQFISTTTTFTIKTTKSGCADNVTSKTVYVDQVLAPQFSAVEWYGGTKITITSTPGAQIYYRFDGTGEGEYTGTFNETREITVYAHATKFGMRDSETTSYTVKSSKPQTPVVQLVDTAEKIAVGKTAVFRWNADPRAKEYQVSLYKDGALINFFTQEANVFSYVLNDAGKYEVCVKAVNPNASSGVSTKVAVTAMAPSTVQFIDDDGTVLAKYTVSYGEFVSEQPQPTHRGHTFTGWYPNNNYYEIPITQDVSYTATYAPIKYDVTFYDVDGVKFGNTQKVSYQQGATPPDYSSKVPEGYIFAGWTVIEASENDSLCDYTCVDANLKLQAVIRWANDELPVYAKIASAKVEPVGSNSQYTVNVKLTNWPNADSRCYLVVALKTKDPVTGTYKTVCAEKKEVLLTASQSTTTTLPVTYNGIAHLAEVYVLEEKEDKTTGSAYSSVTSADVVFSTTWTDWSDWSTTRPASADGRTIETKTQYRYQDKETTTSSSSNMSGWTLYDSSWAWSSWGSWSSWGPNYQTSSDSKQVETRTEWRYYYFYCPVCGGHEPFQGTSDCHQYSLSSANWNEGWFPTAYKNSNWKTYSYTSAKRYTESLGDGQRWNFSTGNLNDTAPGTIDAGGAYPVIRTAYRYRTRSQVWTYYFYRWTAWSNWSDTKVTASSTRNVETRTLYRYRDEVQIYDSSAGTEDTSGTAYTFNGTINIDQDLSGKVATLMVYQSKNMDPNQYQMQYIGQTTIQDGNQYSVSFIPIKEPTAESGNYVVSLGIQGTTGLLSVDVIEAPREAFTVRFLMDDGSVISSQTVLDGDNAAVPAIPSKAGYKFAGWSESSTGIYKNTDIVAQFEKEQYIVAFVDWANETLGFQKFYYGDTLTAPYTPSAEGRVFKGWDAILNGNTTVQDNMVVAAVYDMKTYSVKFLDADGAVLEEQTVEYGTAAVLPEGPEADGKVFLGWSTDVTWWNVTDNIVVAPIMAYEQTTMAPVANVGSFEIGMTADVVLESESGATIYYTTDGTAPTRSSTTYKGRIHLEETTIVSAMAVAEGKNDSEVVNVFFVYDDTPQAEPTETIVPLDTKNVDAVSGLEIPLEVEIKNNPGLIGYTFIIECNQSNFYIDTEEGDRVVTPGEISRYGTFTVAPYGTTGWAITWLCSYPCTGDGALFTIPLKVSDEPEAGTYTIKLGYAEGRIYTEKSEDITLTRERVHFTGSDITHEHSYEDVVTPPTCTEQGYTTHTCICGDSYVDSYVPALGHNYVNGVCTRCGEKNPMPFVDVPSKSYYTDAVLWAVQNGITSGTSETTFSPNDGCTRAQVVTFLWRAAGSPEPKTTSNPFADVPSGKWYSKAVLWAAEEGITAGTSATTFSPNATCTRGQIVTFLWRYEGQPSASTTVNPFKDVKTGAYYEKAVLWAAETGVTSGTSATTFSPNVTCTRAQVVTFLYRDLAE